MEKWQLLIKMALLNYTGINKFKKIWNYKCRRYTFSNLSNTSAASSSVDEVKIVILVGAGSYLQYTLEVLDTGHILISTWFIENVGAAGKLRIGRNGLDVVEIFNNGNTTFAGSYNSGRWKFYRQRRNRR